MAIVFLVTGTARAGTMVADSGFRPAVDGFSFSNYGNDEGFVNLNAAEMVRMYGREACLSPRGKCVLDPGIRSFMEYLNDAMDGGHCFGFAALSELIHAGRLPDFGFASIGVFGRGANPYGLSPKSKLLQRSIARAYAFQVYPVVNNNIVEDTPLKVLRVLHRKLNSAKRESWNISIRRRDGQGGHAITPYAIEDMGNGVSHIHVYDNNWPGDSTRRLVVNRKANTWSYYAATRPGNEQAKYEGDAETKSFRLKPIDPALGVQPCLQCTGRKGEKLKRNAITLSSPAVKHSRLLLTDSKGRRSGFLNGRMVNRIPGVRIIHPETGIRFAATGSPEPIMDANEPVFMVPKDLRLRIKVIGRQNRPVGLESVNVAGPTFDAAVERLRVAKGKPALIRFNPRTGHLATERIGTGRDLSARVGARSNRATFQVGAGLENLSRGSRVSLTRDKKRKALKLNLSRGTRAESVTASVTRFDRKGRTRFEGEYELRKGQRAEVRYGQLARGGAAWLVILRANGSVAAKLALKLANDE